MMTLLLAAAAAAYLYHLHKKKGGLPSAVPAASDLFSVAPPSPAAPAGPDQREAIDSLLEVRDRLAATESLTAESAAAVDRLWLDLLHGRDRA